MSGALAARIGHSRRLSASQKKMLAHTGHFQPTRVRMTNKAVVMTKSVETARPEAAERCSERWKIATTVQTAIKSSPLTAGR